MKKYLVTGFNEAEIDKLNSNVPVSLKALKHHKELKKYLNEVEFPCVMHSYDDGKYFIYTLDGWLFESKYFTYTELTDEQEKLYRIKTKLEELKYLYSKLSGTNTGDMVLLDHLLDNAIILLKL